MMRFHFTINRVGVYRNGVSPDSRTMCPKAIFGTYIGEYCYTAQAHDYTNKHMQSHPAKLGR